MDVTQFNFIRISKAFAITPRFATLANIGGSGEKYREIPRCVHNRGDQALLEQGFSINAEIASLNTAFTKCMQYQSLLKHGGMTLLILLQRRRHDTSKVDLDQPVYNINLRVFRDELKCNIRVFFVSRRFRYHCDQLGSTDSDRFGRLVGESNTVRMCVATA